MVKSLGRMVKKTLDSTDNEASKHISSCYPHNGETNFHCHISDSYFHHESWTICQTQNFRLILSSDCWNVTARRQPGITVQWWVFPKRLRWRILISSSIIWGKGGDESLETVTSTLCHPLPPGQGAAFQIRFGRHLMFKGTYSIAYNANRNYMSVRLI
jgi:hypothetical protein